mgnify:CR=1 FL=1
MAGEHTWGRPIGLWGLVLAFLTIPAVRSPAGLDHSGYRHVVPGGVVSDICFDDGQSLSLSWDAILDLCDATTQSLQTDSSAHARLIRQPGTTHFALAVPLRDWSSFERGGPDCEWGIGATSLRDIGSCVVELTGNDAENVVYDAGPCLPEHVRCTTFTNPPGNDKSVAVARPMPSAVALGSSGLTLVAYWRKRRQGGLVGL